MTEEKNKFDWDTGEFFRDQKEHLEGLSQKELVALCLHFMIENFYLQQDNLDTNVELILSDSGLNEEND